MSTKRASSDLGVGWHLPTKSGSRAKRPFAYSTVSTLQLLEVLAEDGLTWVQVPERALYDPDAARIAAGFVGAGLGDDPIADHVFIDGA